MADPLCGSERVLEVTDGAFVTTKDGTVAIEKAHQPTDKTLRSGVEPHHGLDGTPKPGENVDESETEVSGSISSGVKKGKGDDVNSYMVSQYSESKEPSANEHSLSFPIRPRLGLVSAMKGSRKKSGEASPTENRRVKWAPDVYDPPVTSVSHSVKSHQRRPRSKKKDKNKQKGRSRGSRKGKKSCHGDLDNVLALQTPGLSSLVELGEVQSEILDYDMGGQEAVKCGSSFLHESAGHAHLSAAEAS
ncbi:hypothetical protein ACP70R_035984 [Stipagrostis hirtigluma subsp. patula]